MEIIQIVGLGIVGMIMSVVLKEYKSELAVQLSLVVGLIIFTLMLAKISVIINVLKKLAVSAQLDMVYFQTILKIIGIAYIAEFGAQICRDAGEGIIATKIEFAAKLLIMVLGIPIMLAILESVMQLLP
ncbi:stage III sporulation protein AD [Halanaerobacter jeridensis]|uniref:Stage III sporulation protein AD n=1 Tax=Halanaerobacter jeridensis TaxID=706427 RepID=A0A938XPS2_9FIRM|nr:stage III sporulation protein AD [Halanaerobacter jeridensis]